MSGEAQHLAWRREEVDGIRASLRSLGLPDCGFGLGLDIGGGDGVHAPWLAGMCDRLVVSDILDYVGGFGGAHGAWLRDLFARNAIPFDSSHVQFHTIDAERLFYRDSVFDLTVSINAFEHIPDPLAAFREAIRVTKPGGVMVVHFDPIWNSPLGHHLPHLQALAPWQHVVEDEETFIASIRAAGGGDSDVAAFRTMMNRWSYAAFMGLLTGPLAAAFSFTHIQRWPERMEEEPRAAHGNFALLKARGFGDDDLIVRGLRFFGVRR